MITTISSKLVSVPNSNGWAQTYEFSPFFLLVATSNSSEGVERAVSGRSIFSKFHDEYFVSPSVRPFESIKSASGKVFTEYLNTWGNFEIASVSVVNNVVYSVVGGGASVLIYRNGSLATILASQKEGITSASGFPKTDDIIILVSKKITEKFSQEEIKSMVLSNFIDSQSLVQELGNAGIMAIKFEDKSENVNVQPPIVEVPVLKTTDMNTKNIKTKISNIMFNIIKNIQDRIPKKPIFVNPGVEEEISDQSKKMTFSVGIILLVILLVSIIFGIRQKSINTTKSKYQGILTEATNEVNQAISLASVSPDKSRELFIDSVNKLSQIDALKVKDAKVEELRQKITDSRASILGEYAISPQLFLDLGLLTSGFKGDSITSNSGNVFILDKNGKRVVSVAVDTKKSKVVAGPGVIDTANDIASYTDKVFILGTDGIYTVAKTSTKVIDKTWGEAALIKMFGGNMYVLDINGNMIYRYAGDNDTFGTQQNWLSNATKIDATNVKSWGIDGAVYLLYPNSKILKFSQGSPQVFKITGVNPQIGNIDAFYVDPDNKYLYILDSQGKRVVVTDKKGAYVAQYLDQQISGATNLVVSEAEKKIILLIGDKLMSIDMKN